MTLTGLFCCGGQELHVISSVQSGMKLAKAVLKCSRCGTTFIVKPEAPEFTKHDGE